MSQGPKAGGILVRVLVVVLSVGWLWPLCHAAIELLDWIVLDDATRLSILKDSSVSPLLGVQGAFAVACLWLGIALAVWSVRLWDRR